MTENLMQTHPSVNQTDSTEPTLVRLALPASLTAAVIGVPSDLSHFTVDNEFLYQAHGIGLVIAMMLASVALLGLAMRAGPAMGQPGRTCVALAYVGTLLVLGNITNEAFEQRLAPDAGEPTGYVLAAIVVSYALFAIGWFGVGVVLARHRLVSAWVAVVLCLGAVYGFTPLPGSYILLLIGIAAAAWSAQRRDAAQ